MNENRRKLSNREAVLLTLLVFAGLVYASVVYLVTPQYDEYLDQQAILAELELNRIVVETEYDKIGEYVTQTGQNEMMTTEKQDIISSFIEEDQIIMTINNFVNDSGIEITNYGFGDFVETDMASINAVILNSENEGRQFIADGKVIVQDITFSASGKYEEFIKFFEFIESSQRKLYVNSVSLSSSEDEILTGSINLSQIAYNDSKVMKEEYNVNIPEGLEVKANIFDEYNSGSGGNIYNNSASTKDSDFVIILNDYGNVSSKFMMIAKSDSNSELYYDSNKQEQGNLTVDKTNSGYSYSYSISDKVYYGNFDELNSDRIILEVISRARIDSSDLVTLRLNITNNTDETLEVYVINDDSDLPRLIVGNVSGNVLMK